MEEKYMVNDILNDSKNFIKYYTDIIIETENIELRNTFKNIRNTLETFQYDLFKISESKGYYAPIQIADLKEMEKIRNDLNIRGLYIEEYLI